MGISINCAAGENEPNPNSSIKFRVPCPLTEYGSKNLDMAGVVS